MFCLEAHLKSFFWKTFKLWKCLATKTDFLFKGLHLSGKTNPGFHLHSTHYLQVFDISDISSFQLKSTHGKIKKKKNVGRPNCFTIAKTPCKNFFQYAGAPFMVFMKLNALSKAMNCYTVSLKFRQLNLLLPLFS